MPRPGSPRLIYACSALQDEAGLPVTQEPPPLGTLPTSPWNASIPRGEGLGGTVRCPQGEGAQAGRHRAGWAPELSSPSAPLTLMGFFFPPPWQLPPRSQPPHLAPGISPRLLLFHHEHKLSPIYAGWDTRWDTSSPLPGEAEQKCKGFPTSPPRLPARVQVFQRDLSSLRPGTG